MDGFWGIQHFQTNSYSVFTVPRETIFTESFVTSQVETTEDPPEAPVDEAKFSGAMGRLQSLHP